MIKKFLHKIIYGSAPAGKTKEGTVKFFNRTKGFGFITEKSTGDEIFVHKTDLIDKIRDKDKVSFEIDKDAKGFRAVNVRKLKK